MAEQSGWQLSGSGPEAYEQYIVPAWMGEWAQDLVDVSSIQAGQRVLDVGCGTGVVTRAIARLIGPSGKVVGLDVNDAMLQMARHFAAQEGLGVITWQQGDAAAMPFPEASYDVVLCQQGLQYFPDCAAALREVARILVPGGRLALSVWRALERHPFFVALVKCPCPTWGWGPRLPCARLLRSRIAKSSARLLKRRDSAMSRSAWT